MKKAIVLLTLLATVAMMSVPAFAHGGHGVRSQTTYEVCAVDGCGAAGLHEHDGTWYSCGEHGAGACGGGHCWQA